MFAVIYETWQQESPMIYLPNEDNELPDDGHTYCEHGVPIDAVPCTRCAPEEDDESYVDIPF